MGGCLVGITWLFLPPALILHILKHLYFSPGFMVQMYCQNEIVIAGKPMCSFTLSFLIVRTFVFCHCFICITSFTKEIHSL